MRLLYCFLILLSSLPLWPQASNSTVRGTVRDQAQAIIPGADVTLTNANTGRGTHHEFERRGSLCLPRRSSREATGWSRRSPGCSTSRECSPCRCSRTLSSTSRCRSSQTATSVEVHDVTPMVRMDSPIAGPRARAQTHRATADQRTRLSGVARRPCRASTPPAAFRLMACARARTRCCSTARHQRSLGRLGLRPPSGSRRRWKSSRSRLTTPRRSSPGPTTVDHVQPQRHQPVPRRAVRNQSQQRLWRRAPPPGHVHQAAVPESQRIRRLAGRPGHHPQALQRPEPTFFFVAWEALRSIYEHDAALVACRPRRCATATSADWWMPGPAVPALRSVDHEPDDVTSAQPLSYRGVPNTIDPARISPSAKYLFSITPLPTHPQINPLVDNNWIGPTPGSATTARRASVSTTAFQRQGPDLRPVSRAAASDEAYQYPMQIMLDNVSTVTNRCWPNTDRRVHLGSHVLAHLDQRVDPHRLPRLSAPRLGRLRDQLHERASACRIRFGRVELADHHGTGLSRTVTVNTCSAATACSG